MYAFDDLEAVENTLQHLAEAGFVQELPRQAGSREPRHGHLLSGPLEMAAESPAAAPDTAPRGGPDSERIAELERALAQLRSEFEDFRRSFE
jgi:uncharacterized protein YceH (UPF0502 family)